MSQLRCVARRHAGNALRARAARARPHPATVLSAHQPGRRGAVRTDAIARHASSFAGLSLTGTARRVRRALSPSPLRAAGGVSIPSGHPALPRLSRFAFQDVPARLFLVAPPGRAGRAIPAPSRPRAPSLRSMRGRMERSSATRSPIPTSRAASALRLAAAVTPSRWLAPLAHRAYVAGIAPRPVPDGQRR